MSTVNYQPSVVEIADSTGTVQNPAREDGNLQVLASTVSAGKVNVAAQFSSTFYTRQDTFTAPANGVTVDAHAAPVQNFAVSVKGTGAAASAWSVVLEASLDGTNFTTVLSHVTALGDGSIMWSGELKSPALYIRSRLVSATLGSATNLVVTILGM